MEFPEEEKIKDTKKAPPNPSFVVRLPDDTKSTANISLRPKANFKIILVLILVFTFVSIMVGFLLWIVQYEMRKRGDMPIAKLLHCCIVEMDNLPDPIPVCEV